MSTQQLIDILKQNEAEPSLYSDCVFEMAKETIHELKRQFGIKGASYAWESSANLTLARIPISINPAVPTKEWRLKHSATNVLMQSGTLDGPKT